MKKYLIVITVLYLALNVYSQDTVASKNAKDRIGDSVIVKGTVSEIFTSNKGNTFISFDEKYPNNTFSVVIFKRNEIDISGIKEGSILTVIGKIISFNDKPEIILYSSEQIVKVE